jgi:CheY-like chemotaxis protein
MKKLNKVLLIDDSEATNYMNQYFFEKIDACNEIVVATNGKEGLTYLSSIPKEKWSTDIPELIMLDIKMPVMDGFEFLEQYEKFPMEMRKSIVTVLLTTSMSIADRDKAKQYESVQSFLNKPLTVSQLKEILDFLFEAKKTN